MALRLRRGTDLERQSVIFEEGELVYTTDTKVLWAGDGQTLGGVKIGGGVTESPIALTQNLDLNGFDVVGAGDVDITGVVVASSFIGDGSGLYNLPVLDVVAGGNYSINIVGVDSSVIVNSDTNTLAGSLTGDVVGDVTGSVIGTDSTVLVNSLTNVHTGVFVGDGSGLTNLSINDINAGDYRINIIGADSSLFVDYENTQVNGTLRGSVTYSDNTPLVDNVDGSIYPNNISGDSVNVLSKFIMVGNPTKNIIEFELQNLAGDLSSSNDDRGSIFFSRNDSGGRQYEALIGGGRGGIYFLVDPGSETFPESNILILTKEGNAGLGTYTPQQKLDVRGNLATSGFVQFGALTTTQRNALTATNGIVIYNSSTNRFQGYQNGTWINLDDGSAA